MKNIQLNFTNFFWMFLLLINFYNTSYASDKTNITEIHDWINCANLTDDFATNTHNYQDLNFTIQNCKNLNLDNPFRKYVMNDDTHFITNLFDSYLVSKNPVEKQNLLIQIKQNLINKKLDFSQDYYVPVLIQFYNYSIERNGVSTNIGWSLKGNQNSLDTSFFYCPGLVQASTNLHNRSICLNFPYQNINFLPFSFINMSQDNYKNIVGIYGKNKVLGFYKIHIENYQKDYDNFNFSFPTHYVGPIYQAKIKELFIFDNENGSIIGHYYAEKETIPLNQENTKQKNDFNFEEHNKPLIIEFK